MSNRSKAIVVLASVPVLVFLLMFAVLVCTLPLSHQHYLDTDQISDPISKRRLPYPYRCALTICNDIDATDSLEEFLTIQNFLNTKNETDVGVGLGLEIGNSFYPFGPEGQFGLVSNNLSDKEVILDLIKVGYIDFIHSFNYATRPRIQEVVNVLADNECELDVWVNHARAPTDLGNYYEWCLGDNIDSNHYHTDFSVEKLGYKFVWTGDVSSVVGQGIPLTVHSFFSALNTEHLIESLYKNVGKELCKYLVSYVHEKYANRKHNDLIYVFRLDDGQPVFGFVRSGVSYRGIANASSDGLANMLRKDIFDELKENGGYMIIYMHLGKNSGYPYIPKATQEGLRLLETEYRKGNIYVTTTAKLLEYYVNNKYLIWRSKIEGSDRNVFVEGIVDPVRGSFVPSIDDLRGITFYTDDAKNTHIYIEDRKVTEVVRNGKDHTNRESIMFPLKALPRLDSKMIEYKEKGYF